ncbi:hypothetical protein ACHHYP_04641 [Achlya hypogyna]|uniref:Secreted protein n=1 Tax=Achlya hypogyna TaxID=1202772 RepID=A0A1V9ZP35_ACHHY|nr:hypothetical protein ACHHYP_04641 [Achlya hypogyna]
MLAPSALFALGLSSALAYVQFDNHAALHLDMSTGGDSPWSAVYLQAAPSLETMDVDGTGGVSYLSDAASPTWPTCNETPVAAEPCSIQVLFAISQCLDSSTALAFKQWMLKLAASEDKFLTGGKQCDIAFSTVILPECAHTKGAAAAPDAKIYLPSDELHGVSLLATERWESHGLLQNVLPTKELIDLFTPLGNVYCSLNATAALRPNAIVSIFSDAVSHKVITNYEQDRRVQTVYNFHVCQGADAASCTAQHVAFADDSVLLVGDADLFAHNPFKAVQSFHCAKALPNGLPVVSLNKQKHRQCHCKCPSGFEDVKRNGARQCVPTPKETCTCFWSNRKYAYDIQAAGTPGTCSISKLYPDVIARIPYPRSNYVGEARMNAGDASDGKSVAAGSPLVQVTVTKRTAAAPLPTTIFSKPYAWTYFELNRDAITNSIVLDAAGLYSVKMTATGYRSGADCEVCVAVVDRFRPVSSARCPAPKCDAGTCTGDAIAAYSKANVALADALYQAHVAYAAPANVVNDGCSEARCDAKNYYRKDMFATDFVEADVALAGSCFHDKLPAAVTTQMQASPFGANGCHLQQALPVADGRCTRCCKFTTQLKELWHDYKCGNGTVPAAQQCSGTDPGCKTTQCLAATGTTFFDAAASVRPAYKKATDDLIAKMYPKSGYESTSEVHLLLECTAFGVTNEGKCAHVAPIDDLFGVAASLVDNTVLSNVKASDFVFWRFRVDGGNWRVYKDAADAAPVRFEAQKSTVVLEAWSQCGLVHKSIFNVFLHLNRKLCVADRFDAMWYQATSAFDGTGALCNYYESDFAELTFDFEPTSGLHCDANDSAVSPYVSTGVMCTVQYGKLPSTLLLASDDRNASVLKRFSFQMLSVPTTKADTTFTIACSFAYEGFQTPNVSVAVAKTFTIKNCDRPGWDCPFGACSTQCLAGNKGAYASRKPAPYQACRGTSVSASLTSTVVATLNQTCCATCGTAVCTSILDTPTGTDDQDISRCIVTEPTPENIRLLVDEAPVVGDSTFALACVCLAVGLLMVGVASHKARTSTPDTDAYYPLLEHK